jgi:hypothetical protein
MILRKLEKTSRVKPTIAFYSYLNSAMMFCESKLEMDALMKLEFDDSVESYVTQPASYAYRVGGRLTRYTPDILVKYKDGRFVFVEVKPFAKSQSKRFTAKFNRLLQMFNETIGHPFELWTCRNIRKEKRIQNFEQLYVFLNEALDDDINARVLTDLKKSPDIRVSHLESVVAEYGQSPHYAWSMIAHQLFTFSNTNLLTRRSTLEIAA